MKLPGFDPGAPASGGGAGLQGFEPNEFVKWVRRLSRLGWEGRPQPLFFGKLYAKGFVRHAEQQTQKT